METRLRLTDGESVNSPALVLSTNEHSKLHANVQFPVNGRGAPRTGHLPFKAWDPLRLVPAERDLAMASRARDRASGIPIALP